MGGRESLLLVDRDGGRRTATRAALAAAGYTQVKEAAETSIAALLAQGGVAAVLAEASADPRGAVATCAWARALGDRRQAVILLAEPALALDREALFARGATDVLPLPASPQELAARLGLHRRLSRAEEEVWALREQARHLSLHDPLTGLVNREHFLLACRRELAAMARHGLPLAALMIDLDHERTLAASLGHSGADALVMTVGQRIESQLRASDLLCRLDGARFAGLLPETPREVAGGVGERLCRSVADLTCSRAAPVTLSLGLAAAQPGDGQDVDGLLAAAEGQMRRARAAGGNRLHA